MKPSQIKQAIEFAAIKQRRPIFLWGAPGVGKSDTIRQIAKENKLQLIDKRMSQADPTELKGYPWPDQEKGVMRFLQDGTLPTKGKGILFLDELNLAPQAVQAPCYQLILDRQLGEYKLPDGWVVIAAGNRSTDRSGVHAMSAALSNRFIHLDFHPDLEDWLDWAVTNGISDTTRGYLRYRPKNLHTQDIKPGERAYPTPRTWAFADTVLNSDLAPEIELEILKGTIGEGCAAELVGFAREARNLPNIDRILLDPDKAPVPESPSTQYAIVSALETKTSISNFGQIAKYVARLPKEFEVMFMQTMARRDDAFCETSTMTGWLRENRSILI